MSPTSRTTILRSSPAQPSRCASSCEPGQPRDTDGSGFRARTIRATLAFATPPEARMTVKVAVVQAPPIVLDRAATISRMVQHMGDVAAAGARLVVFPEAY